MDGGDQAFYFKVSAYYSQKEKGGNLMLIRKSLFLYLSIFALGLILVAHSIGAEPIYKALNPRGIHPDIKLVPLSKRLPDLKNKVVYIVNIGKPAADLLCPELEKLMKEAAPGTNIVYRKKISPYMMDEPNLWKEIGEKGNAAIVAIAD